MIKKVIKTPHGSLRTPFFMPDATRGVVKLLNSQEVYKTGIRAMVVNTFHLYLQPGMKIIKKAGGIHKFMDWSGPLLSDSGGYQVFSLIHKNPQMGKILDDKVVFKSPIDGSEHDLTPEKSIQIQFDLGVDMMVCLDDCPPNDFDDKQLSASVDRTVAWAKRCKKEYEKQIKKRKLKSAEQPLIFGVIQGGMNLELRERCARELFKIGFDGYGFGGRHRDGDNNFLDKVLKFTVDLIPDDKLKFALGIGSPEDVVRCAKMGWDMFDCVIPTREGRHARLFFLDKKRDFLKNKSLNFYKKININNAKFIEDFSVINEDSDISQLNIYTKAYLHHLFKIKDPLSQRLSSLINLEFYANLIKDLRG